MSNFVSVSHEKIFIVHSFNEKNGKYYDATLTKEEVKEYAYFPLYAFEPSRYDNVKTMEQNNAEETWRICNSLEKAMIEEGFSTKEGTWLSDYKIIPTK